MRGGSLKIPQAIEDRLVERFRAKGYSPGPADVERLLSKTGKLLESTQTFAIEMCERTDGTRPLEERIDRLLPLDCFSKWARSSAIPPPDYLIDVAAAIRLLHDNQGYSLTPATEYPEHIDTPDNLPPPSEDDRARFIFDNAWNSDVLEAALLATRGLVVHIERDGWMMDVLSFLCFRYPNPSIMPGLRGRLACGKRPRGRRLDDILNRAGFQGQTTEDYIYQLKRSVRRLLIAALHPWQSVFVMKDEWHKLVLPDPRSFRYGDNLIPRVSSGHDAGMYFSQKEDATATPYRKTCSSSGG